MSEPMTLTDDDRAAIKEAARGSAIRRDGTTSERIYLAGKRAGAAASAAREARLREALAELVAVQDADPIRNACMDTPGYRWHDAWQAARAALSDTKG